MSKYMTISNLDTNILEAEMTNISEGYDIKIIKNVPFKLFDKASRSCRKGILTSTKNNFRVESYYTYNNFEKKYLCLINDTTRRCSWLFACPRQIDLMDIESLHKYGIGTLYYLPYISRKRAENKRKDILDEVINKFHLDELK